MKATPSAICQCCTGKQPSAVGFKWQYYDGPPIDWQAVEPYQTPLETLLQMRKDMKKEAKGRRGSNKGSGGNGGATGAGRRKMALQNFSRTQASHNGAVTRASFAAAIPDPWQDLRVLGEMAERFAVQSGAYSHDCYPPINKLSIYPLTHLINPINRHPLSSHPINQPRLMTD